MNASARVEQILNVGSSKDGLTPVDLVIQIIDGSILFIIAVITSSSKENDCMVDL